MTLRTALCLMLALPGGLAVAQAPEPGAVRIAASTSPELREYAKLPVCTLSADGLRLAVEPCRTAPARKPMPRRPVSQIIQRMPVVKQAPQVAMPAAPPSPSLQTLLNPPNAPKALNNCGPTGCNDASGARINNAGPGTAISPAGKVCNRNGVWLQC
ncbi:hypothetical protein [Duganella violaceipulchra]|uniref:Uncharacterized protein n=1 Tax=Duganella violaceipulchra TaxID=2849652 RepID=A0AA41H4X2_9BURK|nr:hypothetical protein [Duganella violaceicalia]MBV6319979.1 hypothetical protein [Duganella violaceicalia]MCP2010344.1 hypothetical protein [Duganella violaceicalia]